MNWNALTGKSLEGMVLTREEAHKVLAATPLRYDGADRRRLAGSPALLSARVCG